MCLYIQEQACLFKNNQLLDWPVDCAVFVVVWLHRHLVVEKPYNIGVYDLVKGV